MQDLRADPEGNSESDVLESRINKGFGPIATVVVKMGTLKLHDTVVAGLFK